MMTRRKRIEKNPRLLFWGKALTELKTMNAIVVLFYLHRGVTMEEVFYLTMVFSIATLILEIPSGYLADWVGRKYTLLVGVLCASLALIVSLFATGFSPFIFVFLFAGAATAMFSGADEALLYDSLKEVKKEGEMTSFNARMSSARNIMKIFMPTIGAFIAVDLLEWQFKTIIAIDLIASLAAFIVLLFVVEPKRSKSLARYESGIYRQSLETIRKHPVLLRVALNKILIVVSTVVAWRVYQPYLTEIGASVLWLGALYVFLHTGAFVSKWHMKSLENHISAFRIIQVSGWLTIPLILTIIAVPNLLIASIAFLAYLIIVNAREPLFAQAMNTRIHSASRATTLSNLNVLKSIVDIPIWLLAGYVSTFGMEYIFLISAAMCIIAVLVFPVRRHDLLFSGLDQELDVEQAIAP